MELFDDCCTQVDEIVNGHGLRVLTTTDEKLNDAVQSAADAVPAHYASIERVARMLERLGKDSAAEYLIGKMPSAARSRSADLGEILATEYIDARTDFCAPIKRLRWKDHRSMAMRGDDVIGVMVPADGQAIRFLKSEVKSRASISTAVVHEARSALDDHGGLPSPHALSFVSDRLHESGRSDLGDLIDLAQLRDGIGEEQVNHLLFVFTGNSPANFLRNDVAAYLGQIRQLSVGLRVSQHQAFIANVYKLVGTVDDT